MQNQQAKEAGDLANDIIKKLANPSETIVTDKTEVNVLDKAVVVQHPSTQPTKVDDTIVAPVAQNDYETRFKRYKISTDKTIFELRQNETVLNDEVAQLKKQLENALTQTPSTPDEMLKVFSTEEVDAFNTMVEGKVSGLQGEVDRLNVELDNTKRAEVEVQAKNANSAVVQAVASAVPNYKAIDIDPTFRHYMESLDAFGNVRIDMLRRAKSSNPPDIGRITQFYIDFANSNKAPAEQPKGNKTFTQQELLQNPSSTPSASPESQQGSARIWNQATISEFYKDKATGKIPFEEAKQLELDMYAALKRARG